MNDITVDNIVEKIENDVESKIESMMEEYKERAEAVREEIRQEKKRRLDELEKRKEREIKTLKNRIISQAELEARKKKLRVREDMIDKVFHIVKRRLEETSASEYEDYIQGSIEKAYELLEGDITIYCNPKAKRIVRDIVEEIDPVLEIETDLDSIGGIKAVSDKGSTIDMTFEANMDRERKDLRKEIFDILFPEEK